MISEVRSMLWENLNFFATIIKCASVKIIVRYAQEKKGKKHEEFVIIKAHHIRRLIMWTENTNYGISNNGWI